MKTDATETLIHETSPEELKKFSWRRAILEATALLLFITVAALFI